MNVKESHIVSGMSRDSSVSRQNPNLVYDAHNIRITTKDGKNSLMAVTNEKGTKRLGYSGDTIIGTPIGDAVLDKYIILFTHTDNPGTGEDQDHIYKCEIVANTVNVTTVFSGDANFSLLHPIETLPIYENENIQKVYWVDGINQPRVININDSITDANKDKMNFSREVALAQTLTVKKFSTGGEFPVGTIQYAFSYFTKFGQESRLIDISPMFYLSPQEGGLDATKIASCSFSITITSPDRSFDYIRLYSIIRTSANAVPQCRIVGDYAIDRSANSSSPVIITDNGTGGRTYPAASMYFIGGEELIASTLAEKDNTLFLGDIKINRPNAGTLKVNGNNTIRYYVNGYAKSAIAESTFNNNVGTVEQINVYYDQSQNVPTSATRYYDYTPNNNRSSYYVRRFKYLETYRLGFIAQYKNGQWSEPIWVGDKQNNNTPNVGAGSYTTGAFKLTLATNTKTALINAGYKRVAPVIVYPQAHERRCVMQGLLCPTMYSRKDRSDNSPYAQSSWFFRLYHNVAGASNYFHGAPIGGSGTSEGEIQCVDTSQDGMYYMDGNVVTFHSPDIECVDASQNTDLEGLDMRIVGFASASYYSDSVSLSNVARVTDHFIETENVGINTELSQIIMMRRTGYTGFNIDKYCYPLYLDGAVASEYPDEVTEKTDILWEGEALQNPIMAWVVYPWHRQGSLNNQQALSTRLRSLNFNTRTAMLKRNITANAWFTNSTYFNSTLSVSGGIYTPKLFNFDQLAGVKLSAGTDSIIYYGNIDKVITSETGKYPIYLGWAESKEDLDLTSISQKSETAMSNTWWEKCFYGEGNDEFYSGTDPVSMKYKSSPHAVVRFKGNLHIPMYSGDSTNLAFANSGANGQGLFIAELIRSVSSNTRFGGKSEQAFIDNNWVRCGESVSLNSGGSVVLSYLQGDCYLQRYDCLKTYPFTNEDINSVIETLSATLETYVNLDFRYDHNRGSGKNVALSPINFNLYNHLAYEQVNNFFTYHGLDYDRFSDGAFPNGITWSLEKHFGEDVDTWTSIDASNMEVLDGAVGKITGLVNFRDDIYAFQDSAFAQLLFNNRVQIPTGDNQPIEITNGMKMQGKRYISTKVGCINKWSIVETPLGLYFNDDYLKSTYMFNGQLTDLSTAKGMKSWMNENCTSEVWDPDYFENCKAFYDKTGRDIYWVYAGTALVYSEIIGQYMSFMDYGYVPLLESLEDNTYAITKNYAKRTSIVYPIPREGSSTAASMTFTLSNAHTRPVLLQIEWASGSNPRNPMPAAIVTTNSTSTEDVVHITMYTCPYYSAELFTVGAIYDAVAAGLPSYLTVAVDARDSHVAYRDSDRYTKLNTYLTNETSSPFWKLGAGDYNSFFGQGKSYWLTFISNSYPTENKIFNNVAWRDIVTSGVTTKPFTTFDHIRVWTENQDTMSVRLRNSLSIDNSRQPISYDAAVSNLRKKFNVWRCQIPRDKRAPNTSRARISNPWCYIKLSREDISKDRHELTDVEVDYFM